MKKLSLLTISATIFAASTSFADTDNTGKFYVKGNIGYSKLTNEKITAPDHMEFLADSHKTKSKNDFLLGLGGGYYITDAIRVDFMLDHFNQPTNGTNQVKNTYLRQEQIANENDLQEIEDQNVIIREQNEAEIERLLNILYNTGGATVEDLKSLDPDNLPSESIASSYMVNKTDIKALTANAYVDLFNISNIDVFAGASLGIAQVKNTLTISTNVNGINLMGRTFASKLKTNLAYALHLGASTKITDELHADLAYSWKNFGSIKHNGIKLPLQGHHVVFGLRYDI